ncbi:PIN domain-containing protein [Sphingomonas sp. YL-JM2C]
MSLTDGRAYARHLIDTAQHFLQSAVPDFGPMTTEHRYYWTAISIELALKAWLSLLGFTDGQLRQTVGHDLAIARSLAENNGLPLPDAIEPVLALVHPFYMQGGFRRPNDVEWPAALLTQTLPFLATFYGTISDTIGATLVTDNVREFERIDGLEIVNCLRPS